MKPSERNEKIQQLLTRMYGLAMEQSTFNTPCEEKLERIGLKVWYRELSVYDTTRAKLSADSVEVTMKLAIPRFKGVDSKCVCIIDGEQHEVYNVAHTTTKDGFRESELTLKTPAYEREVIDDTERTE